MPPSPGGVDRPLSLFTTGTPPSPASLVGAALRFDSNGDGYRGGDPSLPFPKQSPPSPLSLKGTPVRSKDRAPGDYSTTESSEDEGVAAMARSLPHHHHHHRPPPAQGDGHGEMTSTYQWPIPRRKSSNATQRPLRITRMAMGSSGYDDEAEEEGDNDDDHDHDDRRVARTTPARRHSLGIHHPSPSPRTTSPPPIDGQDEQFSHPPAPPPSAPLHSAMRQPHLHDPVSATLPISTVAPSTAPSSERKPLRRASLMGPLDRAPASSSASSLATTSAASASRPGLPSTVSLLTQRRSSVKRANDDASSGIPASTSAFDLMQDPAVNRKKDRKGKARAVEEVSSVDDPLDPLASVKRVSILGPTPVPMNTSPKGELGPHHATTSFDSIPSTSSGTRASALPTSNGEPSLQQLLQGVDLSAALKLVQTLQAQQPPPPPPVVVPPPPPPLAPPSLNYSPAQPASDFPMAPTSESASIDYSSSMPITPTTASGSYPSPFNSPLNPIQEGAKTEGGALSVTIPEGDKRRRSLSVGFGKRARNLSISAASTITSSPTSIPGSPRSAGAGGNKAKLEQRIVDERIAIGESGRTFEGGVVSELEIARFEVESLILSHSVPPDQISRVHLSLSPSTLRRAQNCAKYLSMRYIPVYAAIEANEPPPNPLAVSRWRAEKVEVERRLRRAKVGGSATLRAGSKLPSSNSSRDDLGGAELEGMRKVSDVGSLTASDPIVAPIVSPYGPRRNRFPKAWEVYPDELTEFLVAGRKVIDGSSALAKTIDSPESTALSPGSGEICPALAPVESNASNGLAMNGSPRPISSPSVGALGSPDKSRLFESTRPTLRSRENSYEAAPFGSGRPGSLRMRSNEQMRTTSSTLKSSPSLGSTGPRSPLGGTATLFASNDSSIAGGGGGGGSSWTTHVSSPEVVVGSSSAHQRSGSQILPARISSGISRQIGRIRGRGGSSITAGDWESSDGGGGSQTNGRTHTRNNKSLDWATPDASDTELSAGATRDRRSPSGAGSSLLPAATFTKHQGGRRRPSKQAFTMDATTSRGNETDPGYRSSGGEDASLIGAAGGGSQGRSRRVVAAGGKMFAAALKTVRAYPDSAYMPYAPRPSNTKVVEGMYQSSTRRARILRYEESEDEEPLKPPRKVIDVADEEFAELHPTTKATRAELNRLDKLLSTLPHSLEASLDELSYQADHTFKEVGIEVEYPFPRLPASVVQSIAQHDQVLAPHRKRQLKVHHLQVSSDHDRTSESSSESESSAESDSDDGNTSDDEAERPRAPRRRGSSPPPPVASHLRSGKESHVGPRGGGKDLFARVKGRTRAATLSVPPNSTPPTQRHSTEDHSADPLQVLERSIEDLANSSRKIDEHASEALEKQRRLDEEIKKLVGEAGKVVKAYEEANYELLRPLEENVMRVQAVFTKPSSSIDVLWAALSYFLTVLFWLSWLVVTTVRLVRATAVLPLKAATAWIRALKWLLFLE